MLGQRIDRHQRLKSLRELPVALELLGVQARPFADQSQRPGWQMTVQDLQRPKGDLSDVLAVLSVKCGGG